MRIIRFDQGPLDVVALGDQTLFVVDYKVRSLPLPFSTLSSGESEVPTKIRIPVYVRPRLRRPPWSQ